MVAFSYLFTLSLMALCAQITQVDAIPRPAVSASSLSHRLLYFLQVGRSEALQKSQRFSFARWVDDKFANPDTALSPEEAWQAYLDSSAANKDDDTSGTELGRRWDSQAICINDSNRAKAADVVRCIERLQDLTSVHCPTIPLNIIPGRGAKYKMKAWCHESDAIVSPDSSKDWGQAEPKLPSCKSVPQTIGVILDTCTTGSGDEKWGSVYRGKNLTGLNVGVSVRGRKLSRPDDGIGERLEESGRKSKGMVQERDKMTSRV